MKLKVTMKSPDALDDTYRDAKERLKLLAEMNGTEYNEDDLEDIKTVVSDWFTYGEYLTIEIDTETGSAHIVRP